MSWLRGPGSPINMATNTPKSVSSPRQATIQASSSGTGTLTPLSISCSLPGPAACSRHEISGFDSRDSAASESLRFRGVMTSPGGRVSGSDVALSGASVPPGAWVLAGNGVVAALGLGFSVGTGSGVSDGSGAAGVRLGATTGAAAVVGAWAGVGSEHPAKVARNSRMMKVAWRNGFSTWSFLFLWWDQPSILLVARPVPLAPIVRNLGALVPFSMSCLRTSGPCSPGPVEVKIPAGVRRGSWAVCCNAPELFRSVDVAASGAPAPRLCSCSGLLRCRWPLGLPCSPWPWPVWQPIPWPFGRRPVGR